MNDITRTLRARALLSRHGALAPRAGEVLVQMRSPGTIPYELNVPPAKWLQDRPAPTFTFGSLYSWRFALRQLSPNHERAVAFLDWLRADSGVNLPNMPAAELSRYQTGPNNAPIVPNEAAIAHFFQRGVTTLSCTYLGTFVAAYVPDAVEFESLFLFPAGNNPQICMDAWGTALGDVANQLTKPKVRDFVEWVLQIAPPAQRWLQLGLGRNSTAASAVPRIAPACPLLDPAQL